MLGAGCPAVGHLARKSLESLAESCPGAAESAADAKDPREQFEHQMI